jgi:hypothetical protein
MNKRQTNRKKRIFIISIIILFLLGMVYASLNLIKPASAAWYSDSWGFRKKLVIDHTKVSGDQTNFPILVSLTDIGLTKAQSTGNDILFTDSTGSGTKLDHEIEKFDKNSGTLVAWVRIPSLSSTTDSTIYMYYGNSSAPSQQNKTGVWDSNYVAVYHLSETSGHHLNSTSTTSIDSTTEVVTQQGTAAGIANGTDYFNSATNYVDIPNNSNLTPANDLTVESWVNITTLPTQNSIDAWPIMNLHSGSPSKSFGFEIPSYDSNRPRFRWYNASGTEYTAYLSSGGLSGANWYYLTGVHDTNTLRLYINASTSNIITDTTTSTMLQSNSNLRFGAGSIGALNLFGYMDEVRISKSARTAGWVTTTYNSVSSPSTFIISGNEEKSLGPVLFWAMNEGYDTLVHSTAPNANNGTTTNATWQTEDFCVTGKCLYFNGSSSYLTAASSVNNVQSVSFWVKPKTNGETIVDFDNGTHYISATNGTISANGFSNPTIYVNGNPSKTLVAGSWQHVEVTTETAFNATALVIGKKSSTYLNGFIDEFKVYDYVRTAAQVKTDAIRGASSDGSTSVMGAQSTDPLNQGLVGYWKMDETSGSAADSSGNGNTGTWNGSGVSHYSTGKFGGGGGFNGTDDYVSVPVSLGSSSWSISLWSKTTSGGKYLGTTLNCGAGCLPRLYLLGNEFVYGSGSYSDASMTIDLTGITTSNWNHWVYEFDGSSIKAYVNGVLKNTKTRNAENINDTLVLGKSVESGVVYLNGSIDDIRVYNRALSPTEVQQLYTWAPGPVGWWKMDENIGTTASDSSGNSLVGTLGAGTAANSPVWTSAKYGSGLSFDGSDDYVSLGNPSLLQNINSNHNWSISLWYKSLDATSDNRTLIYTGGTTDGWALRCGYFYGTNQCNFHKLSGTYPHFDTVNNAFVPNVWQHLEITGSGSSSTIKFYINGVDKTGTGTDFTWTGLGDNEGINIGFDYSNTSWKGLIDDVKIYNYTRTPAQIAQDMTGSSSTDNQVLHKPVASYDFNEGYGDTAHNAGTSSSLANGDLAGSGATCPTTGACPTWTNDGKFEKALNFDGADDYVDMGSDTSIDDMFSGGGTFSAWIKLDSFGEASMGRIFDKASTISNFNVCDSATYCPSSRKSLYLSQVFSGVYGQWSSSTDSVYTGSWIHVAVTYNNSSVNNDPVFYVNGKVVPTTEIQTPTGTASSDAATNLYIGERSGGDRAFDGSMDEIQLFRTILTPYQIKLLYNQEQSSVMGSTSTASDGRTADNSSAREYCVPGDTSTCSTPLAHWKFDENTQLPQDSSGNNFNGLSWNGTNNNHYAVGKNDKALNLKGTTKESLYLGTTSGPTMSGAVAGTIEAWINIDTITTNPYIYNEETSSGGYTRLGLQILSTGKAQLVLRDNANDPGGSSTKITGTTILSTGKWYHIAATFNSTTDIEKIYINGIDDNATGGGAIAALGTSSTGGISIGCAGTSAACLSGYEFKGKIDNLIIYNYARTPAQVAWDYNHGAPIAQYDFDECTGDVLHDTHPTNNKGTTGLNGTIYPSISGNTTVGTCGSGSSTEMWNDGTNGKYSASLGFDGVDDYVTVADDDKFTFGDSATNRPFSLSAWVYLNDATADTILAKFDAYTSSTKREFMLWTNSSDQVELDVYDQSAGAYIGRRQNTTLSEGVWHHIIATYNGGLLTSSIQIYIDGHRADAADEYGGTFSTIDNTTAPMMIGYYINTVNNRANLFDGKMDDVRIYNYALTATQVTTLYNQDSAVKF